MEYSPLLAIITGVFEFIAAFFTFFSSGRKRILYPTGVLLLILAGYQFLEVVVCYNPGQLLFARIAFFDITWLPAIAMWLGLQLIATRKKWMTIIPSTYSVVGLALAVWVMIDPSCVTKSVCEIVIARYISPNPFEIVYALYYQSGILVLIFLPAVGLAYGTDPVLRKHMANLQVGILGFVLPSLVVRILVSNSSGITLSVMCHFAVFLAVSLVVLVVRDRSNEPKGIASEHLTIIKYDVPLITLINKGLCYSIHSAFHI